MGRLTTHVLDTARGRPGAGMTVELFRLGGDAARSAVKTLVTNGDGRADGAVLEGESFRTGTYEFVFHAGDYFRERAEDLPDPPFVDLVVIRFGVADPGQHYHVPLLVSPWSYSTYRGS